MAFETGWVIEHESSPVYRPHYLTLTAGQIGWSADHSKAFRMARVDDVKNFLSVFLSGGEHRPAEHGWGP